ncbi:MAG: DUF3876 domain-containing protein [Prevotella sp.]|jgi:hypothetical protein|nr:DUF3876 domain-containing protein [Prevotella sp.]
MKEEEYQSCQTVPTSWLGGWESVNGNPDVYIFQGYDGNYYLLAYCYDEEYGHGCFSCYEIYSDEEDCYIGVGTKHYQLTTEDSPYTLHIAGWGGYMQN